MNNNGISSHSTSRVHQNAQPSASSRRSAIPSDVSRTVNLAAANDAQAPAPAVEGAQLLTAPSAANEKSSLENVQILAKHGAFFSAGMMPFLGAATAHTGYQAYNVISNAMAAHAAADYSLIGDVAGALSKSTVVGATLMGVGILASYPLGRFVIAPAAGKSLNALPTEPKDAAISLSKAGWDATKNAVSGGSAIAGKCFGAVYEFGKTAHQTVPAALVKLGFFLGSATDQGSEVSVTAAKKAIINDTRLTAAEQRTA